MDDKYDKTSGKTATAELDHQPPDRRTDAGLGMFERVNDLVGEHRIGTAPAFGGAVEQEVDIDRLPGIVGVDRIRFTEEDDRYFISTFESDYVLVRSSDLGRAADALEDAGHVFAA